MGVQVPPFALLSLGRSLVVALTFVLATSACADPGAAALDRTVRGLDGLIAIAEKRARGELDEAVTATAIDAWQRAEGAEITSLSQDAARALGAERRRALAARWKDRSAPLAERVRGLSRDFDDLRR